VRTIEAAGHVGRQVRLQGWLHQFRELGKVNFLIIRDGWGTFQAIVDDPTALAALRAVQVESVIEVRGVVAAETQAPGGAELHETEVTILEPVTEAPPIEVNKRELKAAIETFLDHAAIGLRHPKRRAILRLAAAAMAGFRATLDAQALRRSRRLKYSARPPKAGPTSSRSTTSANRPTWRSRRSCISRSRLASSSGSTRSGRCFAPSLTRPRATWPNMSVWTSNWASSRTIRR
jgi:nondiscriminating aspartyl-tRNA synthetase